MELNKLGLKKQEVKDCGRMITVLEKIASELQGIHTSIDVQNAILMRDHLVGDAEMDKRVMDRLKEITTSINRAKFMEK